MVSVKDVLNKIKSVVRGMMDEVAKLLDSISNGFIEPWHITLVSLVGHVVILFALAEGMFTEAALLIAGFGLMDALDGAVARFQGTASLSGMLLDSTTDRIKEALIFAGLAFWFAENDQSLGALYAVLALGMSVSVSYVKAKGEVALLESADKTNRKKSDVNREFEDGIFGYEVRMFVLIVSLLLSEPMWGVGAVLLGSTLTFMTRFNSIVNRLHDKN